MVSRVLGAAPPSSFYKGKDQPCRLPHKPCLALKLSKQLASFAADGPTHVSFPFGTGNIRNAMLKYFKLCLTNPTIDKIVVHEGISLCMPELNWLFLEPFPNELIVVSRIILHARRFGYIYIYQSQLKSSRMKVSAIFHSVTHPFRGYLNQFSQNV
jgi:hypothetical protein